jgi:hypothetical protein
MGAFRGWATESFHCLVAIEPHFATIKAMGRTVKLSDALVLDARLKAKTEKRSIVGQIEYWANLGRAIDGILQGSAALAPRESGVMQSVSSCLKSADSEEGRQRVSDFLESQSYPQYQPSPTNPRLLVRISASGKRTVGRFVNRKFVAVRVTK